MLLIEKIKTMKKKSLFIFTTLLLSFSSWGQNLVPNPSFEEYHYCNDVAMAKNWTININSADYYHSCALHTSGVSIPFNDRGYQYANSGDAYFGFFSYAINIVGDYVPEYFGCKLNNELSIGEEYYFSCKINLSNYSSCASNNIGALFLTKFNANVLAVIDGDTIYDIFSEVPPNSYFTNFSHINCTSIVTDTLNWQTISGSFIADSAYRYMIIGNFFAQNLTDTLLFNDAYSLAYYYIDDVCLSNNPTFCEEPTQIIAKPNDDYNISIFPNPAENYFHIEIDKTTYKKKPKIEIYTALGKLVHKQQLNEINTKINTTGLKSGVYFIKIYIDKLQFVRKLFINH